MKNEIGFTHVFKVHLPNLLDEIVEGAMTRKQKEAMRIPINILKNYLGSIAERASQLNDPILNMLMVETVLYEIANPESSSYDEELCNQIVKEGKQLRREIIIPHNETKNRS